MNYEDLKRGDIFTKPSWPTPFVVLSVASNGTPELLTANIRPRFFRQDSPITEPVWCHCPAFPVVGLSVIADTQTITVTMPTVPIIKVGNFLSVYEDSDFYEVTHLEHDTGVTQITAVSIKKPIFYQGERIQ